MKRVLWVALLVLSGCPSLDVDSKQYACVSDSQCGDGFVCQQNLCVPVGFDGGTGGGAPTGGGGGVGGGASMGGGSALGGGAAGGGFEVDAGDDAGLTDAGGSSDAAVDDAGTLDAGTPDSGAMDSGAPDASVVDAGGSDAGSTDAGPTDAGASDAGALDAGVTDAGPPDAGFDAGPADAGRADAGPSDAGQPILSFTPNQWDFGTFTLGSAPVTKSFLLTNSGTVPATGCTALSISDTVNFTLLNDACGTGSHQANLACGFSIRANPTSIGLKTVTVSRSCTFGGSLTTLPNQIQVMVNGATLAWSPLTWGFGTVTVGSTSPPKSFVLSNSGNIAASGCAAPFLSNPTDFTIATDGCGTASLDAGTSCTVAVSAKPNAVGAVSTILGRTCAVGGSATTTAGQVTATGLSNLVAWYPSTWSFGAFTTGTVSADQVFTLTNPTTTPLLNCGPPGVTNSDVFRIVSDTCGTLNLLPGQSCSVTVRGIPPDGYQGNSALVRNCWQGGTLTPIITPDGGITVSGNTSPTVRLRPQFADFGPVAVGSTSSRLFAFYNGSTPQTGCSIFLSNPTDFSVNDTCGPTRGAFIYCGFQVTARPQSAGRKTTTLYNSCNESGLTQTRVEEITVDGLLDPALDAGWTPQFASLAGYWRLRGTGTVADAGVIDAGVGPSARGYTSGTSFAYAALNAGLNFNMISTADRVEAPLVAQVASGQPVTVMAWVYPNGDTQGLLPVMTAGQSGTCIAYGLKAQVDATTVTIYGRTNAGDRNVASAPRRPGANHVALVYSGGSIYGFINGAYVSAAVGSTTSCMGVGLTGIGETPSASGFVDLYNGVLSEVAIFNAQLSNTDVQTIYARQVPWR